MQEKLPVAVIGMGGFGRIMLEALQAGDLTQIVGLADRDPLTAERAGKQYRVPAFTDNRRLLAEARPRAVYLAVPPAAAVEIVMACAERGIHVWKELPLARSLSEAHVLVERMSAAKLKFAVGTQWRFRTSYRRAAQVRSRLGQVFLARTHYLFNWGPDLGWRGDRATAGGGALLELGYHCVDLLTWMLGLPEEVFCRCAGGNRPNGPRYADQPRPVYDTDDTAATVLQYANGCMASVVTTRSSGPVSEELSVHGREGSLKADSQTCLLRDPDGNVLNSVVDQSPPMELFRRQVEAFARAVITDAPKYQCSAWENLLNQAVLDVMYLSDRTCQPESPARLMATCGLTVERCLSCRPLENAPD
ncbi:MAG: Gfo/Idh/MocA family oxidoreductase [Planctomycetaceae bacterium]|nr:Gfo/Idh/MocA family oxidoreductase [Planctomycetaceae bacterium]